MRADIRMISASTSRSVVAEGLDVELVELAVTGRVAGVSADIGPKVHSL